MINQGRLLVDLVEAKPWPSEERRGLISPCIKDEKTLEVINSNAHLLKSIVLFNHEVVPGISTVGAKYAHSAFETISKLDTEYVTEKILRQYCFVIQKG